MGRDKKSSASPERRLRPSDIDSKIAVGRRSALAVIGGSVVGTAALATTSRKSYGMVGVDVSKPADPAGGGRFNDIDSGKFADPAGGGTDADVSGPADPARQTGFTDSDGDSDNDTGASADPPGQDRTATGANFDGDPAEFGRGPTGITDSDNDPVGYGFGGVSDQDIGMDADPAR